MVFIVSFRNVEVRGVSLVTVGIFIQSRAANKAR